MKITIEPETEAEKAETQNKRVVMGGMAMVAMIAIPAERPAETALYLRWSEPAVNAIALLQQRAAELTHQLTKARLIAETQQAQQQPRIQVAQPAIPFPAGNDRMRGQ